MFYDRYLELCNEKGVSPSKAALSNGISKTSVTRWKDGAVPNPDILSSFASYFNVSIDYLLGKTDIKKEPSIEEDAELMELLKKPALKAAWDLLKQMDERQIDVAYSQLEALMRLRDK